MTSDTTAEPITVDPDDDGPGGHSRRTFIGYVMAGTTLVVGADFAFRPESAEAAIPSIPQIPELFDLEDLQTKSALPTSTLISIEIGTDGIARFEMPRMEVGQGITTAAAMIIADELDMPLDQVEVSLAPARPELVFNQLTGGSNTMNSMYTPIRVAAATARGALLGAASTLLGREIADLTVKGGVITDFAGEVLTFGQLSEEAASTDTKQMKVTVKKSSDLKLVGTPQNRIDALEAVTGRKQFTTDLDVPDALPTMVCRPPTVKGSVSKVNNQAAVARMPGVTDVAVVDTGVAVRARTFGQCIDAVRALDVT